MKAAKAASKPSVKVDAPEVEVNVPITVNTEAIAAVLSPWTAAVNAAIEASIAAQAASNARVEEVMARSEELSKELLKMKLGPIKISTPDRPNDFSVEFDDENGDPTTMRIHANAPH